MQPIVLVTIDVLPDKLADFLSLVTWHAAQSRLEPGCVRFDLLKDLQYPNRFTLHEIWRSQYAIELHKETPHYKAWRKCVSLFEEQPRSHHNLEVIDQGAVVFTNGCFDVFHAGHLAMLKEARSLGGKLIVAVNSDESVKRLKGVSRPICPLPDRMALLQSLSCVDEVLSFDSETELLGLIRQITPNILVKGGDYRPEHVKGADIVTGYGGRVHIATKRNDLSTTNLLYRLLVA